MDQINAEVFVAVSELGSFRKAADKLGYTQAGISYIINSMEERTGFRLFEREFGGVKLTEEGAELLPVMKRLQVVEQEVDEQIDRIKGLESGHITLLAFNTAIVCLLPDILDTFKRQYPNIQIELLSCDSPEKAERKLLAHEADCAFLAQETSDKIELIKLREEPNLVVIAKDHPMAKRKVFPIKELANYPFIGYPEEEAPDVYAMARRHNINFNQIMTVNNDFGCFSMISKGIGFGIYSRILVEQSTFPVVGIPIEENIMVPYSLGFRSYDRLSLAAKAFVDHVKRTCLPSE